MTSESPRLGGSIPEGLIPVLGWTASALLLASVVVNVNRCCGADQAREGLVFRLFNADREANFPTYLSVLLWVFCGIAAGWIARSERGAFLVRYWSALTAAFFALSVDEMVAMHELSMLPLRQKLGLSGYFYFSWVAGAIPVVAIFAMTFARFLGALPKATRNGLVMAGAVYVTGAVGMEMLAGKHVEASASTSTPLYIVLMTVEEGLEMGGAILCLRTLLRHLAAPLETGQGEVRRASAA